MILRNGLIDRRRFLGRAAAGTAALIGTSCAPKSSPAPATRIEVNENPLAAEGTAPLELSIARWERGLELPPAEFKAMAETLTRRAIADLGGMERFVSKGDTVWITPNIGFRYGPEFAVNTNPDLVGTLVQLCFDAGAKQVKVGCNAAYGAALTYARSGIRATVEAAGGEMITFDPDNFVQAPVNGERLISWPVYRDILEADLVINAPIVKHHGLAMVTSCMKNYMGMVGDPRYTWHTDLPACLSDITAFMKPRLTVLDAIRILIANGPEGGELDDVRRVGMVAAGTNVVALDALAAELLGLDPAQGKTLARAMAKGLGHIDFRNQVRTRETLFA
jgi:uncharacterized protein (DUF362 family)